MTSEEQRYLKILAERGLLVPGTCVPRYEAVAAALAELDALRAGMDTLAREAVGACREIGELRAAGDALAAAARGGLADIRDRSPVRPPLVAALAGWAAARGEGDGGGVKGGAEAAPESEARP